LTARRPVDQAACKSEPVNNIVRMPGFWGGAEFDSGGDISMADAFSKLGMAAALGALLLASGMSGCSSISTDHVDCNVVKLQTESGRSDAEIASAIGGSVKDVAACRGEKSGNKSSNDSIPSAY
jgi:hypothetical protein